MENRPVVHTRSNQNRKNLLITHEKSGNLQFLLHDFPIQPARMIVHSLFLENFESSIHIRHYHSPEDMAAHYSIQRRVEFSETDMAGIMHFSNFFRFMEAGEHAFLRSLGYSVVMTMVHPPVGWPRVHCECDFKKPVRFEDVVEVHLKVLSLSSRTITYGYEFNLVQAPDSLVANGKVIAACVTRDPESGQMKSIPIPESLKKAIAALTNPDPH